MGIIVELVVPNTITICSTKFTLLVVVTHVVAVNVVVYTINMLSHIYCTQFQVR